MKGAASIPQLQADWNEADSSRDSFIRNKPSNLVTTQQLAAVTGIDAQNLAQFQNMLATFQQMVAGWPAARTNRPAVSGNYNLQESDLGVVLTAAGSICFAPAYDGSQSGEYDITNASDGNVTFQAASGESIWFNGNQISSVTLFPNQSLTFARETTTHNWTPPL